MVLAVISYFALATLVLALLFLPGVRARALGWVHRVATAGVTARQALHTNGQQRASQVTRAVGHQSAQAAGWLVRHRAWVMAGSALLVAAPLVPLALRGFIELDGFDHRVSREANPQVQALLVGEQLVPPPPVPPEWFTTREVEMARPLIRGASRQWELLDPDFRQRLLVVFKLMQERHGIEMVLLEGYRSPERQTQLADMGAQMTRAAAFESWHQYGLAADCAFIRDGRIVISERDAWAAKSYALYGEVARSVGLTWGGSWRSIQDYGHTELPRAGVLKRRAASDEPAAAQVH